MKICAECKWHLNKSIKLPWINTENSYICQNETVSHGISHITGEREYISCVVARSMKTLCGPDATQFEARE